MFLSYDWKQTIHLHARKPHLYTGSSAHFLHDMQCLQCHADSKAMTAQLFLVTWVAHDALSAHTSHATAAHNPLVPIPSQRFTLPWSACILHHAFMLMPCLQ